MPIQRRIVLLLLVLSNIFGFDGKRVNLHLDPHEAQRIAIETFIYGYALVTSEITRVQMTNSTGQRASSTPMGVFNHLRTYPPASYHGVVAPNADTLYSIAWVDLENEPWLFSHPEMNNRFYLFPIYSLWTPILDDSGIRTSGSAAATYALIGPNQKFSLPDKIRENITKTIYSPTRFIVILGRTYCNGTKDDYDIVHQLQDQYLLRPLSAFIQNENNNWKKPVTHDDPDPPFNQTGSVRDVIKNMNVSTYFNIMATRMKDNPPSTEDALMVIQMARLGLIAGETFDLNRFNRSVQEAIMDAPRIALDLITLGTVEIGVIVNNWLILNYTGSFDTKYLRRAAVSMYGWGGNKAEDAIYPSTNVDSNAQKLVGIHQYQLHFSPNQTPPVNGFWSLTMYDSDLFFVPNPLNKYTVSPRDSLVYNVDGSLDLYIQQMSPGPDKEPNWLPAPPGNFILMLRMYWPKISVFDIVNGTWKLPPIVKVS